MSLIHRYVVIATPGDAAAWVRDQFVALGDGGAVAEAINPATPLCAAGDPGGAVAAYCCGFACSDATRTTLLGLTVPAGVTWLRFAALGPTEGQLVGTNSTPSAGLVGTSPSLALVVFTEGYAQYTVEQGVPDGP